MPLCENKPKPEIKLLGEDGNAFAIIARAREALKNAGYTNEELDEFQSEAMKGSYNNVLVTVMEWCTVIV